MKTATVALFGIIFGVCMPVYADVVTAGYLHDYIKHRWNLDIPHTVATSNVVNMHYLMSVIDRSNAQLNGAPGTSYADDAASAVVTLPTSDTAVDNLIKPEYKFFFTPATDDNTYAFEISAAGTYVIDWGDAVQVIQKSDTALTEYSHTYTDGKPASAHEIKLGGRATKYDIYTSAAIRFYNGNKNDNKYQLKDMRGCLGCIFSTITDTSVAELARQPRFIATFSTNKALTSKIPAELFNGVTGAPVNSMFTSLFEGDANLSGSIPEELFSGLAGAPASSMFSSTFSGCNGLTGPIPARLFAGISGTPAANMFKSTFAGCTRLEGIDGPLFSGINGKPAQYMFSATFNGCTGLRGSIPAGLFGKFDGPPQNYMFHYTFYGCTGLTGPIPGDLFVGIKGAPAPRMFSETFTRCSGLDGPIPGDLFKGISGPPADYMFNATFYGCSSLTGTIPDGLIGDFGNAKATNKGIFKWMFYGCKGLTGPIPDGMFAGVSGEPASEMFYETFAGCSGLTSIGKNMFGDISGPLVVKTFQGTFSGCTGLGGPSATVGLGENREYLYQRWPDTEIETDDNGIKTGPTYLCYSRATGLDDWEDIPKNWGGPNVVE